MGAIGMGGWQRGAPSSSGSCIVLETSAVTTAGRAGIPSLQLTWKGDEPLDRLHIVLKVLLPNSNCSIVDY